MLGKPSAAYFAAALEELDAEAELAWMVGDDLESDIAGARARPEDGARPHGQVPAARPRPVAVEPDVVLDSIADLPTGWTAHE